MPGPRSFTEWMVGQNIPNTKKKRDTPTASGSHEVFKFEVTTDDETDTDSVKVTYPRTRTTGKRSSAQPVRKLQVKKTVRFSEDEEEEETESPPPTPVKSAMKKKPKPKPVVESTDEEESSPEASDSEPAMSPPRKSGRQKNAKLKKSKKPKLEVSESDTAESESEAVSESEAESTEEEVVVLLKKKEKTPKGKKIHEEASPSESSAAESSARESEAERFKKAEAQAQVLNENLVRMLSVLTAKPEPKATPEPEPVKKQEDKKEKGDVEEKREPKAKGKGNDKDKPKEKEDDNVKANGKENAKSNEKGKGKQKPAKSCGGDAKPTEKPKDSTAAPAAADATKPTTTNWTPFPPREIRQPNLMMPVRSKTIQVEHVIEDPTQDPRPNTFLDQEHDIARVYHGPYWGNPYGALYPRKTTDVPVAPPSMSHPLNSRYDWGTMPERHYSYEHYPYHYGRYAGLPHMQPPYGPSYGPPPEHMHPMYHQQPNDMPGLPPRGQQHTTWQDPRATQHTVPEGPPRTEEKKGAPVGLSGLPADFKGDPFAVWGLPPYYHKDNPRPPSKEGSKAGSKKDASKAGSPGQNAWGVTSPNNNNNQGWGVTSPNNNNNNNDWGNGNENDKPASNQWDGSRRGSNHNNDWNNDKPASTNGDNWGVSNDNNQNSNWGNEKPASNHGSGRGSNNGNNQNNNWGNEKPASIHGNGWGSNNGSRASKKGSQTGTGWEPPPPGAQDWNPPPFRAPVSDVGGPLSEAGRSAGREYLNSSGRPKADWSKDFSPPATGLGIHPTPDGYRPSGFHVPSPENLPAGGDKMPGAWNSGVAPKGTPDLENGQWSELPQTHPRPPFGHNNSRQGSQASRIPSKGRWDPPPKWATTSGGVRHVASTNGGYRGGPPPAEEKRPWGSAVASFWSGFNSNGQRAVDKGKGKEQENNTWDGPPPPPSHQSGYAGQSSWADPTAAQSTKEPGAPIDGW
ncbi:hypothetical protein B0H66DRAFT_191140 [Apodospora peruviana]|uniref:Uncharacterized protein n=1 Tax=Apodospora peruviana TaxID=516989 RepID=A0AAE0M8R8_9PEZI|nr:hypothetical protein B0H66DRAFT_191140 [Apodospora peruviana]